MALSIATLLFAAGESVHIVQAADVYVPGAPTFQTRAPTDFADRFEVRFGVFAHGVSGAEEGTVSINGELVTPRLFSPTGPWAVLVPRIHAGGFVNVSGRTNSAYAGLLWTVPLIDRFFIEGYLGAAAHDGSLGPTATRAGLGCPVLLNSGASLGYRVSDNWSVMATFNHMSNGRELFSVDYGTNQGPGRNQGLSHYGVRIGYSF